MTADVPRPKFVLAVILEPKSLKFDPDCKAPMIRTSSPAAKLPADVPTFIVKAGVDVAVATVK